MASTASSPKGTRLFTAPDDAVALGAAFAIVLGFYFWTATSSAGLPPEPLLGRSFSDYYNLLVHGILKGHLYLDVPVDAVMASSPNPYDPKVWVPHGWMMDASFYRGHYYIYYGLLPALVYMLPFRLLTGGDLWLGTAGEVATTLAFLSLVWLWLRMRRDLFPRAGAGVVFATVIALGLASGFLSLARRPLMYEFAIANGSLFTTLMLHCLYSALSSPRKALWMAAAGGCLGLAVGCRPTFLFVGLAPAWVLWTLCRRDHGPRLRLQASARLAVGFCLGGAPILSGILLYNYLRFSSIFDFGYRYLLQDPVCDLQHIWSTSFFWFILKLYYGEPLEWTRYFPFATMGPVPKWPDHYYGVSDIFGILKYTPAVWFALAAPVAWWRIPRQDSGRVGAVLGMGALAYLGPGVCELWFGNAALRYEVDFLPNLVLLAALGACAQLQVASGPWEARAVRVTWLMAAIASAAVAALLSIPLEGTITVQRGNAYTERVARILNVPTAAYEHARGWRYGPLIWKLRFPDRPPNAEETLAQTPNAELWVRYLPGRKIRVGFKSAGSKTTLWSEDAEVPGNREQTLSASFGSLYPTAENPYYLARKPEPLRSAVLVVGLNGHPLLKCVCPLDAVACEDIRFADGHAGAGWFSGPVLKVSRDEIPGKELSPELGTSPRPFPVDPREHLLVQVVFPSQPHWGLSEPLLFTGEAAAHDGVGVVLYGAGQGRFYLEHAGRPHQEGPFLTTLGGNKLHQIEIVTPVFTSYRGNRDPSRGTVVVKMDGQEVLHIDADLYPSRLQEAQTGTNPFGGVTESEFVGALLEQRWIEVGGQ